MAGPERKSRVMSEQEKLTIAYHEAGHGLVGHVLRGTDPIHKISIVARGRALGWTLALPTEDKYRSEEHTSELQSLMRTSYAVFCLKKKNTDTTHHKTQEH